MRHKTITLIITLIGFMCLLTLGILEISHSAYRHGIGYILIGLLLLISNLYTPKKR